jgi:cytochrome oxidase assembly protein ShyY1
MSKSGLFLFGGMGVTTAGLGVWQMTQYFWTIDAIEKRGADVNAPISTMNDISSEHGAK